MRQHPNKRYRESFAIAEKAEMPRKLSKIKFQVFWDSTKSIRIFQRLGKERNEIAECAPEINRRRDGKQMKISGTKK